MNDNHYIANIVLNSLFSLFAMAFICLFITNFILNPTKNEVLKAIIFNLSFIVFFLYVVMSSLITTILLKQYNLFVLWITAQNEKLINILNKSSRENNLFNSFSESIKERSNLSQMFVFPWSILCFYGPQWLQVPMYLQYRNLKKISNLEIDLLIEVKKVKGIQNQEFKTIVFSTKDIWFWAIVFNISLGMLAPIWIFFYLRKVRHFMKDVRMNLSVIENGIA